MEFEVQSYVGILFDSTLFNLLETPPPPGFVTFPLIEKVFVGIHYMDDVCDLARPKIIKIDDVSMALIVVKLNELSGTFIPVEYTIRLSSIRRVNIYKHPNQTMISIT